jgi:hypothetical protein
MGAQIEPRPSNAVVGRDGKEREGQHPAYPEARAIGADFCGLSICFKRLRAYPKVAVLIPLQLWIGLD